MRWVLLDAWQKKLRIFKNLVLDPRIPVDFSCAPHHDSIMPSDEYESLHPELRNDEVIERLAKCRDKYFRYRVLGAELRAFRKSAKFSSLSVMSESVRDDSICAESGLAFLETSFLYKKKMDDMGIEIPCKRSIKMMKVRNGGQSEVSEVPRITGSSVLESHPLKDRSDKLSVISLFPAEYRDLVEAIPDEYLSKSESELSVLVRPTSDHLRLRFNFWDEYLRIVASGEKRKFDVGKICHGVGGPAVFKKVLGSPALAAWVFSPIGDYDQSMGTLLQAASDKLLELMTMDIKDEKGNPREGLIRLVLKAFELADSRLHGSPTQRIESKTLNVTRKVGESDATRLTDKALEEDVKALEERLAAPIGAIGVRVGKEE